MEPSVARPEIFLSLDRFEGYAGTSLSDWLLIREQIGNFRPLDIKQFETEGRSCEICFEPFGHSYDGSPLEMPIELDSCGHVFGHKCLYKWLVTFTSNGKWWNWQAWDAYWPHMSEEAYWENDEKQFHEALMFTDVDDISVAFQNDRRKRDWRDHLNWRSDHSDDLLPQPGPPRSPETTVASCPKCRGKFGLHRVGLPGWNIKARVHFWDCLYKKIGISRSPKEKQCRRDLVRYIRMVREPKINIERGHMRSFTLQAQASAMRFALRRGNRELDPQQTYLRDAIFNLGCYGLHEGEYSPDSYENRKVPLWCYQVDRIESGLDPKITTFMYLQSVLNQMDESEQWDQARSSMEFYQELRKQISGPWRRKLFTELGGLYLTRTGFLTHGL